MSEDVEHGLTNDDKLEPLSVAAPVLLNSSRSRLQLALYLLVGVTLTAVGIGAGSAMLGYPYDPSLDVTEATNGQFSSPEQLLGVYC